MRLNMRIAAVAIMAACDFNRTAPANRYAGTYSVTRVNGSNVPAPLWQSAAYTATLVSGTLSIHANGTWKFDQIVRYRTPTGEMFDQDPPVRDEGTYQVEGDHMLFVDPQPNGAPFVASATANGMLWSHGLLAVYDFQSLEFTRR